MNILICVRFSYFIVFSDVIMMNVVFVIVGVILWYVFVSVVVGVICCFCCLW